MIETNEKRTIFLCRSTGCNSSQAEKIEVKERIDERKKISDLGENDQNVEIMGTIVQVFDPRFFTVDPEKAIKDLLAVLFLYARSEIADTKTNRSILFPAFDHYTFLRSCIFEGIIQQIL